MRFERQLYRLLKCFILGVIIQWSLASLNEIDYSSTADEDAYKMLGLIHLIVNKPALDSNYIFINTSNDITTIQNPTDEGYLCITDRQKLAEFFKILADNNNPQKFLYCNIFFDEPTACDYNLLVQIKRCKSILFPSIIEDDTLRKPIFAIPTAIENVVSYTGNVSKMRLLYFDSLKAVPLVLAEKVKGKKLVNNQILVYPETYITLQEIVNSKNYFNLGDLTVLSTNDSLAKQYFRNKVIFMGDFENKNLNAVLGETSGIIILINAYINLLGVQEINAVWWNVFMVLQIALALYFSTYFKISTSNKLFKFIIEKIVTFGLVSFLILYLSIIFFHKPFSVSILYFWWIILSAYKELE